MLVCNSLDIPHGHSMGGQLYCSGDVMPRSANDETILQTRPIVNSSHSSSDRNSSISRDNQKYTPQLTRESRRYFSDFQDLDDDVNGARSPVNDGQDSPVFQMVPVKYNTVDEDEDPDPSVELTLPGMTPPPTQTSLLKHQSAASFATPRSNWSGTDEDSEADDEHDDYDKSVRSLYSYKTADSQMSLASELTSPPIDPRPQSRQDTFYSRYPPSSTTFTPKLGAAIDGGILNGFKTPTSETKRILAFGTPMTDRCGDVTLRNSERNKAKSPIVNGDNQWFPESSPFAQATFPWLVGAEHVTSRQSSLSDDDTVYPIIETALLKALSSSFEGKTSPHQYQEDNQQVIRKPKFRSKVIIKQYPCFNWDCELDTDMQPPVPETEGLYDGDDDHEYVLKPLYADPGVMLIPGIINRRNPNSQADENA